MNATTLGRSVMANWTAKDISDLNGRTAVVTGASSGIGEEAAEALAGKGAHVILAVRNEVKGSVTRDRIRRRYPAAKLEIELVDMADLASIRAFSARMSDALPQLDILINNAGLGMQPRPRRHGGWVRASVRHQSPRPLRTGPGC